jgi:sugar-specific transcriptional regulator TrmB
MSKLDELHSEVDKLLGYECVFVKLETYNNNVDELHKAVDEIKFQVKRNDKLREAYLKQESSIESREEYWKGYSEESVRIESQLRERLQQAEKTLEKAIETPTQSGYQRSWNNAINYALKAIRGEE